MPRVVLLSSKVFKNIYLCRFDGPDMSRRSKPGTQPGQPHREGQDPRSRGQVQAPHAEGTAIEKGELRDRPRQDRGGDAPQDQGQQAASQAIPDAAVQEWSAGESV